MESAPSSTVLSLRLTLMLSLSPLSPWPHLIRGRNLPGHLYLSIPWVFAEILPERELFKSRTHGEGTMSE